MKLFTKLILTFALLCCAGVYSAFAGTEVTLTPGDLTAVTSAEFTGSKGDVSISCTTGTVTEDQIRKVLTRFQRSEVEKIIAVDLVLCLAVRDPLKVGARLELV